MSNGKPMSKSQLSGHIAEKAGITKKTAGEILDLLAQTAYSEAKSKGEFNVPSLGKFVAGIRKACMRRNPATGETIHIPEKKVVKFRIAKSAKDNMV